MLLLFKYSLVGSDSIAAAADDVMVTPSLTCFHDAPEVGEKWRHLEEWRHLGAESNPEHPVATYDRQKGKLGESIKEIVRDVADEIGAGGGGVVVVVVVVVVFVVVVVVVDSHGRIANCTAGSSWSILRRQAGKQRVRRRSWAGVLQRRPLAGDEFYRFILDVSLILTDIKSFFKVLFNFCE